MVITEKHTHILDKAETLFALNGYEGTTVRDIATAAGVNLAMISYYFGSKEKLFEVLFKERMEGTRLRIEAIVNNKGIPVFQKLELLIDQYIERVFSRQDFYRVMLTEQMLNKNKVIIKFMQQYKLAYTTLIDGIFLEGKKQKVFRKDVDTMLLMNTMTGTVMQILAGKDHYREFNNYGKYKATDFDDILKEKLALHLKKIFKATLVYE